MKKGFPATVYIVVHPSYGERLHELRAGWV
jgi:hypothetical protein